MDSRAQARDQARACGAAWRDTPAEAAAGADVLLTVLPGPDDVRAALTGEDGALACMHPGSAWIDMTSNTPVAARPLQREATERGVRVLEAPVGGGIEAARSGQLQIFAGGDSEVLRTHRQLLETFADPEKIMHVGGLGAGYTAKLLVNLVWFGQALATSEALLIGQAAGIDSAVLRGVLAGSAAESTFVRHDLGHLLRGDYLPSFSLDRICGELDAVVALGEEYQVPHELTALVSDMYHRALDRFGAAKGELLAVALLEEEAGQRLRSADRPPHG